MKGKISIFVEEVPMWGREIEYGDGRLRLSMTMGYRMKIPLNQLSPFV